MTDVITYPSSKRGPIVCLSKRRASIISTIVISSCDRKYGYMIPFSKNNTARYKLQFNVMNNVNKTKQKTYLLLLKIVICSLSGFQSWSSKKSRLSLTADKQKSTEKMPEVRIFLNSKEADPSLDDAGELTPFQADKHHANENNLWFIANISVPNHGWVIMSHRKDVIIHRCIITV